MEGCQRFLFLEINYGVGESLHGAEREFVLVEIK